MTILFAILLALVGEPTASEAEALRHTAPEYLTLEAAGAHLRAARAAGLAHRVPAELLLSIAWHESRYTPRTQTPEPGGRVSCGVLTPMPQRRCSRADLTMLGGYDAGAAHLRVWLDVCGGSTRCALLSYAGGGVLARACVRRAGGRAGSPTRSPCGPA